VLGPLLFLIYINDIDNIPLSPGTKLVIYADDVLLYKPIRSAVDHVLLQKDVDAVGQWSTNSKPPQVQPHKMQGDGLL